MTPQRWRVVAVVATAAVLAGSLAPGSTAGGLPAGADKLLHAVGYAVVAFSIAAARRTRALRALAAVVVAMTLLGVGIEVVQPMVGRNASLLDAFANLLGATAGVAVWRLATS